MEKHNNKKAVSYNRWGYLFLLPFLITFVVFQLIPLATTIYNGFFENYRFRIITDRTEFCRNAKFCEADT